MVAINGIVIDIGHILIHFYIVSTSWTCPTYTRNMSRCGKHDNKSCVLRFAVWIKNYFSQCISSKFPFTPLCLGSYFCNDGCLHSCFIFGRPGLIPRPGYRLSWLMFSSDPLSKLQHDRLLVRPFEFINHPLIFYSYSLSYSQRH